MAVQLPISIKNIGTAHWTSWKFYDWLYCLEIEQFTWKFFFWKMKEGKQIQLSGLVLYYRSSEKFEVKQLRRKIQEYIQ